MQTSAAMRAMIEAWEGCPPTSYNDVVGVLTGGYGHTGPDVPPAGTPISKQEADGWLTNDLMRFESAVLGMAHTPTQQQFDALVSFSYNLGEGALRGSTLLKEHNAGNFSAAGNEFLKWDHASGQQLAGLTSRRQGERGVYLNGAYYDSQVAPSPIKGSDLHLIITGPDVARMQKALGVIADGSVGPLTLAALTTKLGA